MDQGHGSGARGMDQGHGSGVGHSMRGQAGRRAAPKVS